MDYPQEYIVKSIAESLTIDGKGSDALWSDANNLTDFTLPWNDDEPQQTSFRALWSPNDFYFLYQVLDDDIVAPGKDGDKLGVLPSDRVEIFFKSEGAMDPYYCLELDPRNRVLDYIAKLYRETDFEWSWPAGQLEIKTSQTTNGYMVEGRISLSSLSELGILKDHEMEAGLFRGDYFHTSGVETDVLWITWIVPDSEKPDFHIPSAFGKLILEQ